MKEGLKCRFVIEERIPGTYREEGGRQQFSLQTMGVEAIHVVPAGSDMLAAMNKVAQDVRALGRKPYVIPGGGSNALGGLGYVECARELKQQMREADVAFDAVVLGSGARARMAA